MHARTPAAPVRPEQAGASEDDDAEWMALRAQVESDLLADRSGMVRRPGPSRDTDRGRGDRDDEPDWNAQRARAELRHSVELGLGSASRSVAPLPPPQLTLGPAARPVRSLSRPPAARTQPASSLPPPGPRSPSVLPPPSSLVAPPSAPLPPTLSLPRDPVILPHPANAPSDHLAVPIATLAELEDDALIPFRRKYGIPVLLVAGVLIGGFCTALAHHWLGVKARHSQVEAVVREIQRAEARKPAAAGVASVATASAPTGTSSETLQAFWRLEGVTGAAPASTSSEADHTIEDDSLSQARASEAREPTQTVSRDGVEPTEPPSAGNASERLDVPTESEAESAGLLRQ